MWFPHSCLHLFYCERKESVSMTSLLLPTSSEFLNLATSCFQNYIRPKVYNIQPPWFCSFLKLAQFERGLLSFTYLLIFFFTTKYLQNLPHVRRVNKSHREACQKWWRKLCTTRIFWVPSMGWTHNPWGEHTIHGVNTSTLTVHLHCLLNARHQLVACD